MTFARSLGGGFLSLRDRIGQIGSFLVSLVLRRPGDDLASKLSFLGLRPGCVQQSGMLILTDIEPTNEKALGQTLENIGARLTQPLNVPFDKTKTVHYAAWMILPGINSPDPKQPSGPARLAFETNYDGDLEDHLKDLVANCRQELDEVYGFSPGYPPKGSAAASVEAFLVDNYRRTSSSIDTFAHYVALPGRSLEDIKNAIAVYDEAKDFIDNPLNKNSDPNKIQSSLINYFRGNAQEKPARFPMMQRGLRGLFVWNMTVLTLLCLVVPILLFVSPWLCWLRGLKGLSAIGMWVLTILCVMPLIYNLRWIAITLIGRYFEDKEQRSPEPFDPTGHPAKYRGLDLGRQNHICTYATVKPGWFRMYLLKRALWIGPVLFKYFFILGKLDQMSTIHFARWTLIGRQLIFCSNYDGSWSSYLSDFSDEAWGVNLVWGNTIGYPETKFIVWRGAHDLEGFETQAAEHYAPAPVFYSAYRDRSLVNLLRYVEFRDKLLEEMAAGPIRQRVRSLLALI